MNNKSTGTQRIRLFNWLRDRAMSGRRGVSMTVLERAFDFESREQIVDALAVLEGRGLIRVDIGGEWPAMLILKDNRGATEPLLKPLVLPRSESAVDKPETPATPDTTSHGFETESTPGKDLPPALGDLITAPPDYVTTVEQIASEVLFHPLPEIVVPVETVERVCEPISPKPKIPARFVRIAMERKVDPVDMILELAGQMLDITGEQHFDLKCGART